MLGWRAARRWVYASEVEGREVVEGGRGGGVIVGGAPWARLGFDRADGVR